MRTKHVSRTVLSLTMFVVFALVLAACGGSATESSGATESEAAEAAAPAEQPTEEPAEEAASEASDDSQEVVEESQAAQATELEAGVTVTSDEDVTTLATSSAANIEV